MAVSHRASEGRQHKKQGSGRGDNIQGRATCKENTLRGRIPTRRHGFAARQGKVLPRAKAWREGWGPGSVAEGRAVWLEQRQGLLCSQRSLLLLPGAGCGLPSRVPWRTVGAASLAACKGWEIDGGL